MKVPALFCIARTRRAGAGWPTGRSNRCASWRRSRCPEMKGSRVVKKLAEGDREEEEKFVPQFSNAIAGSKER